jgi:hypothetical protein
MGKYMKTIIFTVIMLISTTARCRATDINLPISIASVNMVVRSLTIAPSTSLAIVQVQIPNESHRYLYNNQEFIYLGFDQTTTAGGLMYNEFSRSLRWSLPLVVRCGSGKPLSSISIQAPNNNHTETFNYWVPEVVWAIN